MKFDILNRFTGDIQFTAEIDCKEDELTPIKFGLAVKWAFKNGANLSRANLSGAILSDANLSGAILSDANLSGANLSGANLSRANLYDANLSRANLSGANLYDANLSGANLSDANLSDANLSGAILSGAYLFGAYLSRAYLSGANLSDAILSGANLSDAYLSSAYLSRAYLSRANLSRANLSDANLSGAILYDANLSGAYNMVKVMGVEQGNIYWKRFEDGLCNNDYQFKFGINKLRKGEIFADDERLTCSSPGFHFASRSWCAVNYPDRPLEAKIKIPLKAKINEPWATDGKASADMIEILQIFDTKTGKDVTKLFKKT